MELGKVAAVEGHDAAGFRDGKFELVSVGRTEPVCLDGCQYIDASAAKPDRYARRNILVQV